MIKSAFIAVASDFLPKKELEKIISVNLSKLHKICKDRINESELLKPETNYYFIVTGGTETEVMILQKKRDKKFANEYIVLIAHESNNSLAASLELLARFKQDGRKGKVIYLPDRTKHTSSTAVTEFVSKDVLKGTRIGVIGKPSDWLVASSPSSETVKESLGAEVVPIEMKEIKNIYAKLTKADCKNIFDNFTQKSQDIVEPSDEDIFNNVKVYIAMKEIVDKYELDAVTVRCFDLVINPGTTGCFALSYLNDLGIIAGCEGDIVSTLGMQYIYKKTKKLPWMANPSRLNIENNSLILAHCTVPVSIVENYTLRSHFESGIGVGIQGNFQKSDVTIFRFGGKNLNKIWSATGVITSVPKAENLCRTQIEVKLDSEYNVADLLVEPLGNHLIIIPGKIDIFPLHMKDSLSE